MAAFWGILVVLAVGCVGNSFSAEVDPCNVSNHRVIHDPHGYRQPTRYQNINLCDATLPHQWYRVNTAAGDVMVTRCLGSGECATLHPVWLNGSIPEQSDGVVLRFVCLTFVGMCCVRTKPIHIRNCGTYLLYKLPPTDFCPSAYCFGGKLPGEWNITTTPVAIVNFSRPSPGVWTGLSPSLSKQTTPIRHQSTKTPSNRATLTVPTGSQSAVKSSTRAVPTSERYSMKTPSNRAILTVPTESQSAVKSSTRAVPTSERYSTRKQPTPKIQTSRINRQTSTVLQETTESVISRDHHSFDKKDISSISIVGNVKIWGPVAFFFLIACTVIGLIIWHFWKRPPSKKNLQQHKYSPEC